MIDLLSGPRYIQLRIRVNKYTLEDQYNSILIRYYKYICKYLIIY